MPRFKPGDVVMLKSGGPEITVTQVENDPEHVWCVWFDGGQQRKGDYPAAALEISKGPADTVTG